MNNKIKILISVFVLSGIAFGYTVIDRKLSTASTGQNHRRPGERQTVLLHRRGDVGQY